VSACLATEKVTYDYIWLNKSVPVPAGTSIASFVECLKLLKAIKVVEKVLKALLKAMTYYQMTNNHASDTG
jgi:hypothetical protein